MDNYGEELLYERVFNNGSFRIRKEESGYSLYITDIQTIDSLGLETHLGWHQTLAKAREAANNILKIFKQRGE